MNRSGKSPTGRFLEHDAAIISLLEHGIFEWDASIQYRHPTLAWGSNSIAYKSVQDSLNKNPTTDSINAYWITLATSGIQGIQGITGIQGIQGVQGATGQPGQPWPNRGYGVSGSSGGSGSHWN